jgi:HSP20 family protein
MPTRTDPFSELDRLTQQLFGASGTSARPGTIPMDAYRDGGQFVAHLDIPGVDPASIELEVERNVLTVRAERELPSPGGTEFQFAERPRGAFSRQLFLGETLDTEHIEASYNAGVLTLRMPIAGQARVRKISVSAAAARP